MYIFELPQRSTKARHANGGNCQGWGHKEIFQKRQGSHGPRLQRHDHLNMSAAVLNFSSYIQEVQQIFEAYSSHDDRTAHDNAIKARPEVDRIMQNVAEQVTQQAPFDAKQQALITTIEIAEWILKEGDRSFIGKYVRGDLPCMSLSSAVGHLLDMLSPEELAALQADGEIPKAIHDLRGHAEAYALDLNLNDSIDRLWLEESDEEDDDRMAL